MNNIDLRSIICDAKKGRVYTESTTIGGIICPLIKMKKWDIYIYGGGTDISSIVLYFWSLGIEIKGILDCDPEKDGKMILGKVPIIFSGRISERFDSENTFVIINTIYFKGIEQYEIINELTRLGITQFYELAAYEKDEMKAKPHSWVDIGRIDYYREHIAELEAVYNMLYDDRSKEIMLEFIRVYMQLGVYRLDQCAGDKKYFYGQNPDGSREELYQHLEDEIWINCGSNIGDNIFWYFANGLNAKAVYAYEADKKVYMRLVKNLKYLPKDYGAKVYPVNEMIGALTEWGGIVNKISLVNADIEGGELDLLKSLKAVIASSRPVLAICAYHKASDLVELPNYIQSLVDDYCFVLRKYESNIENIRKTAELVLYAIPKERIGDSL